MALVVEDGTGKSDADSYCSLTDALVYHERFGTVEAWDALDDEVKEASLRKATRYVDASYTFNGMKQTAEQALAWPRIGATRYEWLVTEGTVPPQVRDAVAQLALDAQSSDLAATGAPAGAVVSETVDVLSVTYASGVSGSVRYRAADQLLAGLTRGRSSMRVSRS
jgi:hypothetical protein